MLNNTIRKIALIAIIAVFISVISAIGSFAAEDNENIKMVSRENNNIAFVMGTDGAWDPELPEGVDEIWHAINPILPISGRFEILKKPGYRPFFYRHSLSGGPADRYAYFALQVDDKNEGWLSFDEGGSTSILGAEPDGWWIESPFTETNQIPAAMKSRIAVAGAGEIDVQLDTRVMHSAVKFRWRIKNNDTVTRYVGLKLQTDNSFVSGGDADPVAYVPGMNFINSETVIQGTDIPDYIDMIDNVYSPDVSARYYFTGSGATKPDVIGFDSWSITASDAFSYSGAPANPVFLYTPPEYHPIGDLALAILWKPRPVKAGQYIDFITYIGESEVTSKFDLPTLDRPQYVPSVEGQRTLPYSAVASDPGTPFRISAFIEDHEKTMSLTDSTATLVLPDGLELVESEGDNYTKTLGTINPGAENSVSWLVQATGNPTGFLDYAVSFNAKPVGGTILTRTVNVPATPTQKMDQHWQMVSVPYRVTGYTNPHEVFGLEGTYGIDYKMWKWDTKKNAYVKVTTLVPGEGYWLWIKNAGVSTSKNPSLSYSPISNDQQYELARGWNIIGDPFVYGVTIGECYFYHPNYGTINYDQAVDYGLISKTMYTYDTVLKRYKSLSGKAAYIQPWKGFWIKALQSQVTMKSSMASQIGASLAGFGVENQNVIEKKTSVSDPIRNIKRTKKLW